MPLPGRAIPQTLLDALSPKRGAAPVNVLAVNPSGDDWVYLTDRPLAVAGLPAHHPLVSEWPTLNVVSSEAVPDGRAVLVNAPGSYGGSRLSKFFRDNPCEDRPVRIFQGEASLAWPDGFALVFDGVLDEISEQTDETLTIEIVGVGAQVAEREVGRAAAEEEFPAMPRAAVGRPLWTVHGTVERLPLVPVDIGGDGVLAVAMWGEHDGNGNPTEPGPSEITIGSDEDAEDFPAGIHTIQIGLEQIRVSRAGTAFTVIARGHGGTRIENHAAGDAAYEIRDHYDYALAVHAVDSITAIHADGIRQLGSNWTTYLTPAGATVVRFTERPKSFKNLDPALVDSLAILDTTGVNDQIIVLDDIVVSDNIAVTSQTNARNSDSQSASGMPMMLSVSGGDPGGYIEGFWTAHFPAADGAFPSAVSVSYAVGNPGFAPSEMQPGDYVRFGLRRPGDSYGELRITLWELWVDDLGKTWETSADNTLDPSLLSLYDSYVMVLCKSNHSTKKVSVRVSAFSRTLVPYGEVWNKKNGGARRDGEVVKDGTVYLTGEVTREGSIFAANLVASMTPAELVTVTVTRGDGGGVDAWRAIAEAAGAEAGDTTRAAYWTTGRRWDFAVPGGARAGETLKSLADNMACRIWWDLNGLLQLVPLLSSPDRLQESVVTLDEMLGSTPVVKRTRRDELFHDITAYYARDYRRGLPTLRRPTEAERERNSEYTLSVRETRPGGARKADRQLDYVRDAETADWWLGKTLDIAAHAWDLLEVTVALDYFGVAGAALVSVSDATAHFSDTGTAVIEVAEIAHQPGSARDGILDNRRLVGRVLAITLTVTANFEISAGKIEHAAAAETRAGMVDRSAGFETEAGAIVSRTAVFETRAGKVSRAAVFETNVGVLTRTAGMESRALRYSTSGAGHTSGNGLTSATFPPP